MKTPTPSPVKTAPALPPAKRRYGAAITLLCASLLLNGYTVYSFFNVDNVNSRPAVQLVTDEQELASLRLSAVGRYATGAQPGDRALEVLPDGRMNFSKITRSGLRIDYTDTYRIGRLDGKLCLASVNSGIIEITNIDRLVYFSNAYVRSE